MGGLAVRQIDRAVVVAGGQHDGVQVPLVHEPVAEFVVGGSGHTEHVAQGDQLLVVEFEDRGHVQKLLDQVLAVEGAAQVDVEEAHGMAFGVAQHLQAGFA